MRERERERERGGKDSGGSHDRKHGYQEGNKNKETRKDSGGSGNRKPVKEKEKDGDDHKVKDAAVHSSGESVPHAAEGGVHSASTPGGGGGGDASSVLKEGEKDSGKEKEKEKDKGRSESKRHSKENTSSGGGKRDRRDKPETSSGAVSSTASAAKEQEVKEGLSSTTGSGSNTEKDKNVVPASWGGRPTFANILKQKQAEAASAAGTNVVSDKEMNGYNMEVLEQKDTTTGNVELKSKQDS